MQSAAARYAIYFTPRPLSPLAFFGAAVIGYDSSGKADVPRHDLNGIARAELVAATEAPRRYGFHATLVAPFHLNGETESRLLEALEQFCRQAAPVRLGPLQVTMLGNFVALTPGMAGPDLNQLAGRCVEFFDPFRAPLDASDLARRNNGRLSPRQLAHLARWGYPYVFEDFRFHMTLTGALPPDDGKRFLSALSKAYEPLADEVHDVDALSLMRQAGPTSNFEVIARRMLQGKAG